MYAYDALPSITADNWRLAWLDTSSSPAACVCVCNPCSAPQPSRCVPFSRFLIATSKLSPGPVLPPAEATTSRRHLSKRSLWKLAIRRRADGLAPPSVTGDCRSESLRDGSGPPQNRQRHDRAARRRRAVARHDRDRVRGHGIGKIRSARQPAGPETAAEKRAEAEGDTERVSQPMKVCD